MLKFLAFDQAIGSCPCIDLDSILVNFFINFLVPGAGIDVNIDILTKRLKNSKKRPLLHKKNISDTINRIYLEREKVYNEADYRIKCSTLKSSEIVDIILKLYENSGN